MRAASFAPLKSRAIVLVEDDSARARRRIVAGVTPTSNRRPVTIRVHKITKSGRRVLAKRWYRPGGLIDHRVKKGKAGLALALLDGVRLRRGTVVAAGPGYGANKVFTAGLVDRGIDFVVELRPSTRVHRIGAQRGGRSIVAAKKLLVRPEWEKFKLVLPGGGSLEHWVAQLGLVELTSGHVGQLFAAQIGGIAGIHRSTIFGVASNPKSALINVLRVVGWARWIRPATRREERSSLTRVGQRTRKAFAGRRRTDLRVTVRANITLARRQDKLAAPSRDGGLESARPRLRGTLASISKVLNVAELFAGAGGMGFGFLLSGRRARGFRVVFSGEVNPICVETLKINHKLVKDGRLGCRRDAVPEHVEAVDLRSQAELKLLRERAQERGGVHVLIGGPPCQGFSNANRNSWHSANPHNRLVDVFFEYVAALRPPVFLLENVQGILWTPNRGRSGAQLSVVEHLASRMTALGYDVFPKLVDAVWYGVPQHRSRFFLLGLRRELGYEREEFGTWGPFPVPTHGPGRRRRYVTVREAISDLPPVRNGAGAEERSYRERSVGELASNDFLNAMRAGATRGVISDHVTSRHGDYVIDRYRQIPRGGNWQDIVESLTNYAAVGRTHSNIYRRLEWGTPSITIGHYRKSMLVHPSQNRGLSLREASRLQSFPDWFRFAGSCNGSGGLVHKQQQLANAVCPLVTRAFADFLLDL